MIHLVIEGCFIATNWQLSGEKEQATKWACAFVAKSPVNMRETRSAPAANRPSMNDMELVSAAWRSGLERRLYDCHDRKVNGSTPIKASLLHSWKKCFSIIILAWGNLTSGKWKKSEANLHRKFGNQLLLSESGFVLCITAPSLSRYRRIKMKKSIESQLKNGTLSHVADNSNHTKSNVQFYFSISNNELSLDYQRYRVSKAQTTWDKSFTLYLL